MEENASLELSLAPEPEQSQDPMDTCSQGFGEGTREQIPTESENVAKETLEEPDNKSSKANSEVKKTWCFRRSTVAKREMPVEAATDSHDNRCPVRRSGRQPKRTDKLEEFLSTAKRGQRKSAPPSLESGDPPSQTPTDAETASEASFDGNADARAAEDKAESPERRTRSGTRKQVQRKSRGGRPTRGGGGGAEVKNEGSSENEEDSRDAAKKDQLADKDVEKKDEESSPSPEDLGSTNTEPPQPEQDSERKGDVEKSEHADENDKVETEESDYDETDEESTDKPAAVLVKRGPIRTYVNKKKAANKSTTPIKGPAAAANAAAANTAATSANTAAAATANTATATAANKITPLVKRDAMPKATQAAGLAHKPQTQEDNDDENDSSTSSSSSSSSSSIDSDEGGYDPNALYCICRQKHNKRFMICCDRCEEWFHGDCVGITEARGRLMERNGEDYICPNCTAKKNQVVRPATSILSMSTDIGKLKATTSALSFYAGTSAEKTNTGGVDVGLSAFQAVAASPSSTAGTEEKGAEDLGIKGRIEKATNPTGKKKIKIFQPALQQPAQPKADQKSAPTADKKPAEPKAPADTEEKVASNVEVKTTPTAEAPKEKTSEDSSLPKCIGPGCENNAQPDSVYCGNGCILRHAAAAMKSITDVKEPKQKDAAQRTKSAPKRRVTGGRKTQKKAQQESDSEEDHSADPDDYDDDEEEDDDDEMEDDCDDENAEEHPPPPATASWSSDHNYIAVTPEKTTPISPTVLNKKSPPKEEKPSEKEKVPVPAAETPPLASAAPVKGNKKSPATKAAKVTPKGKKPSPQTASSKVSRKPAAPPSKTAAKSKKQGQAAAHAPSRFPSGPIHVTGALRVTKSNFTIPKKAPQQKEVPSSGKSSSSSRVPSTPVPTAPSSHSSSSRPPHSAPSATPASLVPPLPPNNQMRTNIRRSLTDIIYKRVNDSDDLKKTETEVARLSVAIEKEMFNLCLNTDSRYKNKYRSLMFNLKDPKNKGLFYRVVGGEVSPFRLVRLSAEELLSKEISEWKKPDAAEAQSPGARAHSGHSKSSSRHDASSHSLDMEDAPPTSDTDVCISATTSSRMASAADQDESCVPPSAPAQPSAAEGSSGMLDIFGTMLKDTTSQHRTHLFDLNCKICTGQKSEDEPAAKKAKLNKKPEARPARQEQHLSKSGDVSPAGHSQVTPGHQHQDPSAYPNPPSYPTNMEPAVPESLQQQLDLSLLAPLAQAPTPINPTVSSVSITRRDPRMARHSAAVTVSYPAPEKAINNSAEPLPAPISALGEVAPKAPLPMPPAPPSSVAPSKTAKTSTSAPPPDGETAIFLHGQEKIWKGLIHMPSVAKFVTKAYLVSGSFEHLKEDLPDIIHVGGRILPSMVWDYVGKLKTSLSKELCLIRFHPATEEEEVAYVSLFSYFSSRKRFGVVANNNRRIKDLYLIPLSSKDPLPSKLLPFDGPGLEPARPNLLLGLLICQKDRKRAGAPLETEEKRFKAQTKDADDAGLPRPSPPVRTERSSRQSLEIPFSTTPPGSPPLNPSETSSSSVATSSIFSFLSSVKATSTTAGRDSPSSSSSIASSAATTTPLQTILKTLFGKKKHDSEASNSPSDQAGELSVQTSTMLDPIVQQFAHISKEKQVQEDEDDRPYDPEEEYDPSRGYSVPKKPVEVVSTPEISKQSDTVTNEVDDVAYDPEDDSIFEDVKPVVPSKVKVATELIADPQKILESLKQIGEQAFQKKAEQPMSSIGTPSASLTLPDALLTQTTQALLANTQLMQLGKKVEELVKSSSISPLINQKRDPRQSRDPRQAASGQKLTDEPEDQEETSAPLVDSTLFSQAVVQEPPLSDVTELPDSSQGPDTPLPPEEVKSETLPFMQSDESEVAIPLLGEDVEPDMDFNYMDDTEVKTVEAEPIETETELDMYSIWPNAASILKANEDSDYEENSQDASNMSYYDEPTNTSTIPLTIPVLTQSTTMVDTSKSLEPYHMPRHMSASGYDSEYRPPADLPQISNFPPPHPMQGQNLTARPLPMSMPPPMQGLPPMSGPPHMQGPPPPMHVPPLVRGPLPMQVDNSQQYGPPPTAYRPPYQNQWPGSQPPQQQQQQQQPPLSGPPPQNIMPLRGPPPFPPMAQRGPAPQMFNPSIPPQHIGQQGLPPGLPPPPSFDGQNSLPPPRFTGPPPPFNFPANRGPPPPFTGPPPSHFENRLPPPSHFPGPRGPPPSQYGDHGAQPPIVDQPRGPAEHYNRDHSNSFKLSVDQNPNPLHIFKDNHGPPPGPAYRGPPPNQYEDRRGPPSSSEMSGQHFNPHNQYESSRPLASPPHRGSFDEHRGPLPQENRPHPSQCFGGSERYRLDRHSDEARPVRHSGPLLPTPPEAPIGPPSRMAAHSPDMLRDDPWRRHSPEMRRRSSTAREESDPRIGDRFSHFEGGHRDLAPGPSQPSEERQRELSEDCRREREREVPHDGRPSWDRGPGKRWSREREWDRARERERDPERIRERDRDPERVRERDRDPERVRERDRDPERSREKDRDPERPRERDRDPERPREREREPERPRERDPERPRERDPERPRERERDPERPRERDHDSERPQERDHNLERSRERDRNPARVRERDRDPERTRERDPDPERTRERDPDPERIRERDRDPERTRERDPERTRGRDPDRTRGRDPDSERTRERDPDPERTRGRDPDPERTRERDPDPERTRARDPDPEHTRASDPDPEHTRARDPDPERTRERDPDPERTRERDPDPERTRGRDPDPERTRGRDPDPERVREKERDPERVREKDRDPERTRGRDPDPERVREKDRDPERVRERDRSRAKEGERHRETQGERHRDQDTDKRRDRARDSDRRDSDRDKGRNRDRERDRDRRRDRSRSRDRDRGKDRGKDREKDRDKDKDKDRDRRDRSRSREKREEKKDSKNDTTRKGEKSAENDKNIS
ncbi:death-inducer obliterator 1-like isoform X2 [Cyclopterus lumpus]|uniref:death-inducer obliterator 1-like isoform X2 n=1 Tax=Cyclopterus lumpus TaxID=8103 RepID=UPI0014869D7D|nr:death-inducer obliterator 1-like isoform X2 [Cyclopterus lumpus]